MSTTIPYDPSLVLGNIVRKAHLDNLKAISDEQAPVDAAQLSLNSALLLKHKLLMTVQELSNLGEDTTELNTALTSVDTELKNAAKLYATTAAASLPKVAELRAKIPQVSDAIESPIDYNKSNIKKMAISSDSLTMDAQYFSFDSTEQSDKSTMAQMQGFVSTATSFLGNSRSAEITASMQAQVSHQREVHDIQGTLVITANCTHKNADLFAPFIIDVDKAIRAWNEMVALGDIPNGELIDTEDREAFEKAASKIGKENEAYYNLISGATHGSSFVGMVHVLKESSTSSDQTMYATAASLQAQMKVGGWFADMEGGFGVSSSFANSAKKLLSSQQITSHVSLIVMGAIPSIVADDVTLAVKQFTNFDPNDMMGKLATLQNSTLSSQTSVQDAAAKARTGGQMMAIRGAEIKSVMSSVGEIEDGKNKMLDINSMMTAFTDYVQKCSEGDVGVPINFFLKPITAGQLYQMWVAKYYPAKYVTSAGDDSGPEKKNEEN